jgi:hypothetical protein
MINKYEIEIAPIKIYVNNRIFGTGAKKMLKVNA